MLKGFGGDHGTWFKAARFVDVGHHAFNQVKASDNASQSDQKLGRKRSDHTDTLNAAA